MYNDYDFSLDACMKSVEFDIKWAKANPFEALGRAIVRGDQDILFNKTMIEAWKKYIKDAGLKWNDEV